MFDNLFYVVGVLVIFFETAYIFEQRRTIDRLREQVKFLANGMINVARHNPVNMIKRYRRW